MFPGLILAWSGHGNTTDFLGITRIGQVAAYRWFKPRTQA
jgi:hypothetical protein